MFRTIVGALALVASSDALAVPHVRGAVRPGARAHLSMDVINESIDKENPKVGGALAFVARGGIARVVARDARQCQHALALMHPTGRSHDNGQRPA